MNSRYIRQQLVSVEGVVSVVMMIAIRTGNERSPSANRSPPNKTGLCAHVYNCIQTQTFVGSESPELVWDKCMYNHALALRAFTGHMGREVWRRSLFQHTRLSLTKEKFDLPRAGLFVHESVQDLLKLVGNVEIVSVAGGARCLVHSSFGHLQVLDEVQSTQFDRRPELFKASPDLALAVPAVIDEMTTSKFPFDSSIHWSRTLGSP